MRIAVGSDHRGYLVRRHIIQQITRLGHEVLDMGTDTADAVDYTDIAKLVAQAVVEGRSELGILVCGTGIGMSIAADKYQGIRAAPCHDALTAEMSRRHNNLNVLCLSADLLGQRLIDRMVEIWINTPFDGGRHARRVEQIAELEQEILAQREKTD